MANRRALVKRRKAVTNTRKITRTMQLIATARFQAAMSRATASQPYSAKLAEMIRDLSAVAEETQHPLMQTRDDVDRAALVVLTSNRGLCGSYNANVLRAAMAHIKAEDRSTETHMVGRKGESFFRFQELAMAQVTRDIDDKPRFDQVQPIADALMERFRQGEIASAHIAYTRFYTPGKQKAEIMQLLPLVEKAEPVEGDASEGAKSGYRAEYEFIPSPEELLDQLLPASVRMRLFQCFNDAAVSEQIARMVAMKAATEAAGDMIKNLTREYNRARQTHITMELLDIVGGANALA
jgi:F-type H+-transporting ATPase subunit gamma